MVIVTGNINPELYTVQSTLSHSSVKDWVYHKDKIKEVSLVWLELGGSVGICVYHVQGSGLNSSALTREKEKGRFSFFFLPSFLFLRQGFTAFLHMELTI